MEEDDDYEYIVESEDSAGFAVAEGDLAPDKEFSLLASAAESAASAHNSTAASLAAAAPRNVGFGYGGGGLVAVAGGGGSGSGGFFGGTSIGSRQSARSWYSQTEAQVLTTRAAPLVARVRETLFCGEDEALMLLLACGWDSRALAERVFESGERAKWGVSAAPDPAPRPPGAGATIFCEVTMEDVPYDDADAGACGHWFSAAAWRGHLAAAMDNPVGALSTRCPAAGGADGCTELVRPRLFRKYLPPPLFARYATFLARSYVKAARDLRVCPAPGCTTVVVNDGLAAQDVICTPAGHVFCFACGLTAHQPASCKEAAAWVLKRKDDGGNLAYLRAHTKRCPKCKQTIEKNGGCNHMICSLAAGGCGHEL